MRGEDDALGLLDQAAAMLAEALASTDVAGQAASRIALAETRVRRARQILTVGRGEKAAAAREAQDAAAAALADAEAGADDATPSGHGVTPDRVSEMSPEQVAEALAENRRRVAEVPTSWKSLAAALGVSEGMLRAWRDEGAAEAPGGRPMSLERKTLGVAIARLLRQ